MWYDTSLRLNKKTVSLTLVLTLLPLPSGVTIPSLNKQSVVIVEIK